ncbi:MAG: hypothetical protein KBC30_11015 [Planctomycetes bacterium]|jgi:hypothetical protein|nr:hypothetical protein [Planctomycetota bacterium]
MMTKNKKQNIIKHSDTCATKDTGNSKKFTVSHTKAYAIKMETIHAY